jgi:nucleolar protein 14
LAFDHRSDATERRTKTLLVEHKKRNSANLMVDRRFGEGDASMSLEERM